MPICGQAPYVGRGLPKHVGTLLSQEEVNRGEVAAAVLELLHDKDRYLADKDRNLADSKYEHAQIMLETKEKEAIHKLTVRRYLQLRGLWSTRGILGAAAASTTSQTLSRSSQLSSIMGSGPLVLAEHMEEAVDEVPPIAPGGPAVSKRARTWAALLDDNPSLKACICSGSSWESTWLPSRYQHEALPEITKHGSTALYPVELAGGC